MSTHLPPNREPEELELHWGDKLRFRLKMWRLQLLVVVLLVLVWAYFVVKALLDYHNLLTR